MRSLFSVPGTAWSEWPNERGELGAKKGRGKMKRQYRGAGAGQITESDVLVSAVTPFGDEEKSGYTRNGPLAPRVQLARWADPRDRRLDQAHCPHVVTAASL